MKKPENSHKERLIKICLWLIIVLCWTFHSQLQRTSSVEKQPAQPRRSAAKKVRATAPAASPLKMFSAAENETSGRKSFSNRTWHFNPKFSTNPAIYLTYFIRISGVVLMCIGVSVQVKIHDTFVVVCESASGVPVIIMTIGTIIILISIFGAVGLLKHNPRMIKMFIGMLLAVLLVETIVGASAYSYREKLHQTLSRNFMETLGNYNIDLPITKAVDALQSQFQCCGAENYTDWLNTTFGSLSPSVPKSCCKLDVESCVTDLSKERADINQQGCVLKLKSWVEEHMIIFGGIGLFIGLTQFTGIVLCYILLRMLKENYESIQ